MTVPTRPEDQPSPGSAVRPPVVDAHVHAFPNEVIVSRDALVHRDHWFGELYVNPAAKLTNADDLLASMDLAGIDHSVIGGFPWSDPGRCRAHNDWMAEVCAASRDRLSWLGIVVPQHAGADREAERCFELGAVGIGELNADGQGFDLGDVAAIDSVIETCVAAQRPMLLHSTEPVGHDYPGKGGATPDRLLRFLAAYPDLDVVLAHWGGGLPFYELMPEVAATCRRVRYDTAASPYLYRHDILGVVSALVGPERILWGSDFPVLGQQRFLRRTRATPLPVDDLDLILGGTARSVYRLPIPDHPLEGRAT